MKPSMLRALGLGFCVIAGCAVAFAAGTRVGSLVQGTTTKTVSVAATAPPTQVVAHNR